MSAQTPGLVCAHHHLYSALARGMPAPPATPTTFGQVLEQIWWRLDTALDLEMLRASARLGAVEALLAGTTGIVDHHESPHAIEGSLDVIAEACAEVGVRVVCAYGVTDRHGADGAAAAWPRTSASCAPAGGGWSASTPRSRAPTTRWPRRPGWPPTSASACTSTSPRARRTSGPGSGCCRWPATTGCSCTASGSTGRCPGTIAHNPRSNMNNGVGYARPAARPNDVVLGTDGIGADMLEEFRLAYVAHRADDLTASPDTAWSWLTNSYRFVPGVGRRRRHVDVRPRRLTVARGVHARDAGHSTSSPATVRCSWPTAVRPASTSTRSGPTPPSRPPVSSPASVRSAALSRRGSGW